MITAAEDVTPGPSTRLSKCSLCPAKDSWYGCICPYKVRAVSPTSHACARPAGDVAYPR